MGYLIKIESNDRNLELALELMHVITEELSIIYLATAVHRCGVQRLFSLSKHSNPNLAKLALVLICDLSRGSEAVSYVMNNQKYLYKIPFLKR